MRRTTTLLAAILLHLWVLYGPAFSLSQALSETPVQDDEMPNIEVTLVDNPFPSPVLGATAGKAGTPQDEPKPASDSKQPDPNAEPLPPRPTSTPQDPSDVPSQQIPTEPTPEPQAATPTLPSDDSADRPAPVTPADGNFGIGNDWSAALGGGRSVVMGGNGHYYEAVAAPLGITWDDAEVYAFTQGGYLVTITSQQENIFVFSLIDDPKYWDDHLDSTEIRHSDGPWIGGFKPQITQNPIQGWMWLNKEGSYNYTHWSSGQPDNFGGHQDRVSFFSSEKGFRTSFWDDKSNETKVKGFIIEYNAKPPGLRMVNPPILHDDTRPILHQATPPIFNPPNFRVPQPPARKGPAAPIKGRGVNQH